VTRPELLVLAAWLKELGECGPAKTPTDQELAFSLSRKICEQFAEEFTDFN